MPATFEDVCKKPVQKRVKDVSKAHGQKRMPVQVYSMKPFKESTYARMTVHIHMYSMKPSDEARLYVCAGKKPSVPAQELVRRCVLVGRFVFAFAHTFALAVVVEVLVHTRVHVSVAAGVAAVASRVCIVFAGHV